MRSYTAIFLLTVSSLYSQKILDPDVVGLRVNGRLLARFPVVVEGGPVIVEFDVKGGQPIDARVRITHCSREWRATESEFVNDPARMTLRQPISHRRAPQGTRAYAWTYRFGLPGIKGLEEFTYSGNYTATILEAGTERPLAEVRFIVAERRIDSAMTVRNRRIPSAVAPWNRAHAVRVKVVEQSLNEPTRQFNIALVKSVDVFKNREFDRPVTIEVNGDRKSTWVENLGTGAVTFVAGGILPGNEYRVLDVRDPDVYPPGDTIRPREGADLSRFFFPAKRDHNGVADVLEGPTLGDIEPVEFQFLWAGDGLPPRINIVGDFSGWSVRSEWSMTYDDSRQRFVLVAPLRRGAYDYQYVMNDTDWVRLEGNEWSTNNIYTAVVYYKEFSLGGYDRVVAVGQAISNGSTVLMEDRHRE